jgi:hypothetical protein
MFWGRMGSWGLVIFEGWELAGRIVWILLRMEGGRRLFLLGGQWKRVLGSLDWGVECCDTDIFNLAAMASFGAALVTVETFNVYSYINFSSSSNSLSTYFSHCTPQ